MHTIRSRALVLLAILLVPLSQLRAQGSSNTFSIGLTGAVNQSAFGGSDASGTGSRIGFAFGGFVRKVIDDTWAFQGELQYTVKGTKEHETGGTSKLNLEYVEIPLVLRAYGGGGESARPFVEFGPALAIKAGCTVSAESGNVTLSAHCSDFGTIKSFDLGAMAGAGVEFPMGMGKLALGIRYNLGLLDIVDKGSLKNRNLQAVVGYRF